MSKTEETNGVLPPPPEPMPAVFTSKLVSPIHTFFVMMICLGSVHFLCILIMASFLLLPRHQYLLVLGMLVVLMFIPINENSKWGLALARLNKVILGPILNCFEICSLFNKIFF
ncbi:putative diacylglycerol O-acyltransferase [Helianthus debilis subsp. tardiflorus]